MGNHAYRRFYTYYYTSQYLTIYKGAGIISAFFDAHLQNLYNRLKAQISFTDEEIKKIEEDYNTQVAIQNDLVKQLLIDAKQKKTQYAQQALNSYLQKTFPGLSAAQYADLLRHLEFNEATQSLQYTGTTFTQNSAGATGLKHWHIANLNQFRVASQIVKRIEEAENILNKRFSAEQLAPYYHDSQGNGLLDLKKKLVDQGRVTISENNGKKTYHGARLYQNLENNEEEIGKLVWNKLQEIKAGLGGIASVNDSLGAVYTELIGHLVANQAPKVAKKTAGVEIQNWAAKTTAGNTNTKTQSSSRGTGGIQFGLQSIDLDQDFLKTIFENTPKDKESYVRQIVDAHNNTITYTLKEVGGSVHGKLDGYINVEIQNGAVKKVPVSFKNYALKGGDAITAQGSGFLLAYLEGAEQLTPNFTEHILNIYSQHPEKEVEDHTDYGAVIKILRDKAAEALRAQFLYSALSGEMQMRQGQEAEILAVYDKTASETKTPLVRLYGIKNLILNMIENEDYTGMRSNLNMQNHWFSNDWAPNPKAPPSAAGSKTRYTKVLYEARTKNIKVSLAKRLLR